MATQSATPSQSSSPPPAPKDPVVRRYKFVWPLLLAVNFSIGVYLYTRTNKEENEKEETPPPTTRVTSTPTSTTISTPSMSHTSTSAPAILEPVKPIPMDEQQELFKWILEEKRKVKTKDPREKKQLDEEKALLKQFIRAKSIPTL